MCLNQPSINKEPQAVAYATGGEELVQKTGDLRVRRTRKLLQKAMLELVTEKGFTEVTVRDITNRAMVNRTTFYRHYLDKYDLLRQYIEELPGLIDSQVGEASWVDQPDQPPAGLVRILKHVQLNADFYRVMLGRKGDPMLCAQSFRQFIEKGFQRILPNEGTQSNPDRPPLGMSISYVLHAGIGAIVWWLEKGQSYTPEQMAVWLNRLSMADVSLALGSSGKTANDS